MELIQLWHHYMQIEENFTNYMWIRVNKVNIQIIQYSDDYLNPKIGNIINKANQLKIPV